MNRAKQLLIAMMCGFEQDHAIYKNLLGDPKTAEQLMSVTPIAKKDIFSATEFGDSFFQYRKTWENFDRLVDVIEKNGESLTVEDLTQPISNGKSVVQYAADQNMVPNLFSAKLWAGRMEDMETVWYQLPHNERKKHDFLEFRRQAAAASGVTLREDQLQKADVSPVGMRQALRTGKLDFILDKLAKHNDHLRKEDLLLSDPHGQNALHERGTWENFDKIWPELAKHGETFSKEDFLTQRGNNMTVLERLNNFSLLPTLFKPDIWKNNIGDMMAVYEAIPQCDRSAVEINKVLTALADHNYGHKVSLEGKVSKAHLKASFNCAADQGRSASFALRPLGLTAIWEQMDSVREALRQNGEKLSLNDLKIRHGYGDETCLTSAVKRGYLRQVMDILEESGEMFSVEDLTQASRTGEKTLLDLVVENNELKSLLRPSLWVGRSQDLLAVWKCVPEQAQENIDFQLIHGEVNRLSLRQKFGAQPPNTGPKL